MNTRRKLSSGWIFGVSRSAVVAVIVAAVATDSRAQTPPVPDPKSVQEELLQRERAWVTDIVTRKDGKAGPNRYGQYPILVLIGLGDVEGLRVLLEAGADPNRGTTHAAGFSPLAGAIQRPDREMALLLLAHGASVQQEASYASAFALALRAHDDEIADAIVKAAERGGGYFRLNKAVGCRWIDAALSEAANEGSAEWCTKLLGLGANPNAPYLSMYLPIQMAAISGSIETVRVLRDAGAHPSAAYSIGPSHGGRTALGYALGSSKARPEMVQLLLDLGAREEVNRNADAVLRWGVEGGSGDKLRVLVDSDAVASSHTAGNAPLELAVQRGYADVVRVLLEAGVQPGDLVQSLVHRPATTHLGLAEVMAKVDPKPERDEVVRLLKAKLQ